MTRAVVATLLSALLMTSSCSGDDDEAVERSASTSATTSVGSDTTMPTTTVGATNAPTTAHVTTPVPSTLGAPETAPSTGGSTLVPSTVTTSTTVGSGFAPVPETPPPDEPVDEDGPRASELAVVQTCDPASPASPAVVLTWRPAAGEQLVAVSVLPDGFETGRYTVTNRLPAKQATYAISPVQPGGLYRWRVLTRSGDGWVASEIAEFTGPTCILDAPSSP